MSRFQQASRRPLSAVVVQLATGEFAAGTVWLAKERGYEALELHLPPGGEMWYREGLGRHKWSELSTERRDYVMAQFVGRMRDRMKRVSDGEMPADEAFAESYPGLHEFLGLSKLPGGENRTRSKVTIFYEGNVFKANLTEPDEEASAFVTSDSFLGVLATLEQAIQEDTLDWRRWWSGQSKGTARKRG